jgi:hypothetical protein
LGQAFLSVIETDHFIPGQCSAAVHGCAVLPETHNQSSVVNSQTRLSPGTSQDTCQSVAARCTQQHLAPGSWHLAPGTWHLRTCDRDGSLHSRHSVVQPTWLRMLQKHRAHAVGVLRYVSTCHLARCTVALEAPGT